MRHRAGNEFVKSRWTCTIEFTGQGQRRRLDFGEPGRHLGLGIDVEYAEKDLRIAIDYLLHTLGNNIRSTGRKLRCEPAVLEGLQDRSDTAPTHRSYDGL